LLADLHNRRSGIVLLAYEKAAGLNNTEAANFRITNPDWIAKDANGNEIHPQNIQDVTLGDLTNPSFRAWQAGKIAGPQEVGTGADGAFIDTLGAYFPTEFYSARPVHPGGVPVTDAEWRDASADLVTRVKAATGKPVIANAFGLGTGRAYYRAPTDGDVLINAADGVQIENFTRTANAPLGQYLTAEQWDQDLAFLELLGSRSKTAVAYTKVNVAASPSELTSLRDYALGSFLLAYAPGRSYVGFDDGAAIPAVTSDAPWARNLGSPTAARTRSGSDGWARQFTNGQLSVRVGNPPVVTNAAPARLTSTFNGTGSQRFPITVGQGSVTATVTFSESGYRVLAIYDQVGYVVAGTTWGYSPVTLTGSLAAGTYSVAVDAGSASGPFTLRVDYPNPNAGATTTTTTTSTTRPSSTTTSSTTSTTRPSSTTTSSTTSTTTAGRRTATFTGSGSSRASFPLRVGGGSVTATLTFNDAGYRMLTVYDQVGYVAGGPAWGSSPVAITVTLAPGTYNFVVDPGSASGSFTLRVDHPAP
jgi:hypothetical protein